jgi:ATP-binding cassette subfamily B protein
MAASEESTQADHIAMVLHNHAAAASARRHGLGLVRSVFRDVHRAGGRVFVGSVLLAVAGVVLTVAQVLAGSWVLDALVADPGGTGLGAVGVPLAVLAGLTVVGLAVGSLTTQQERLLGQLVLRDTDRRILDVTTRVPLESYETPAFLTLLTRIEHNAVAQPLAMVHGLIALTTGGAAAMGLGVVLASVDPILLPLLALTAVPVVVVNRYGGRHEFAFAEQHATDLRERLHLADVLKQRETAKEVRAFAVAPVVRRRWDRCYDSYIAGVRRLVATRTRLALVGALVTGALLLCTLLFLVWRVRTGAIGLGQAAAAVVAMRLLASKLLTLAGGASSLFEARLFVLDLHKFLALAPPDEPADVPPPAVAMFSRLEVRDIGYRYPESDRVALDGVSMEVRRGEIVALVGENGSGKTTLSKILAGLMDPTTGTVLWDGRPIAGPTAGGVRPHVSVIFQDFARFQLSARDNIAVGRGGEADEAALDDAARNAGVADVIHGLLDGWDTVLSALVPGGTDLSIGQWQRIALARAVYRDAGFVVLDEPTSAMDPEAEQALFSSLREVLHDRTVLLISHRFSTVRDADRIYVLADGRVVECGDHDALMARGGRYAAMFTAQASGYLPAR